MSTEEKQERLRHDRLREGRLALRYDASRTMRSRSVGSLVRGSNRVGANHIVRKTSDLAFPEEGFGGGEVCEGGFGGPQDIFCTGTGPPAAAEPPTCDAGVWQTTADMDSTWFVHRIFEAADGSIYAGTGPYGKVYRTTDSGNSWEDTNTLPGVMKVYDLAQTTNGVIYAGTYPHGDVFKTTNGGDSWTNCAQIPGATTVRGLCVDQDTLYAATFPSTDDDLGFVYKTEDGGSTWHQLTPLPGVVGGAMRVTMTSRQTLLCGCYGGSAVIYRSTDRGNSWSTPALPISAGDGEPWSQICFIREVAQDTIYVGGWVHVRGGFVWRSTNDGVSWDTTATRIMVNGVRSSKVYDLVRQDDGVIIVGYQSAPDSVVCLSPDKGATWIPMGPFDNAREALSLLRASDGVIYAGTTPYGDVFKYVAASGIQEGGGKKGGGSRARLPLISTFPNPSPRAASIAYRVLRPGHVSVRIFDVAGGLVRTLVDAERLAGLYVVDWDGTDSAGRHAASNSYYAELKTASGISETARIVLVR